MTLITMLQVDRNIARDEACDIAKDRPLIPILEDSAEHD